MTKDSPMTTDQEPSVEDKYPLPWRRDTSGNQARFIAANSKSFALAEIDSPNDRLWTFILSSLSPPSTAGTGIAAVDGPHIETLARQIYYADAITTQNIISWADQGGMAQEHFRAVARYALSAANDPKLITPKAASSQAPGVTTERVQDLVSDWVCSLPPSLHVELIEWNALVSLRNTILSRLSSASPAPAVHD